MKKCSSEQMSLLRSVSSIVRSENRRTRMMATMNNDHFSVLILIEHRSAWSKNEEGLRFRWQKGPVGRWLRHTCEHVLGIIVVFRQQPPADATSNNWTSSKLAGHTVEVASAPSPSLSATTQFCLEYSCISCSSHPHTQYQSHQSSQAVLTPGSRGEPQRSKHPIDTHPTTPSLFSSHLQNWAFRTACVTNRSTVSKTFSPFSML